MLINKRKIPKKKLLLVFILGFLALNIFVNYEKLKIVYKYNTEQIETIFYIHENLPKNSKILVPYVGNRTYIYELLIGYDYVIYYSTNEYLYIHIKGAAISMKLKYIIIDLSITYPSQLDLIINDEHFKVLFKNDLNMVLEYNH